MVAVFFFFFLLCGGASVEDSKLSFSPIWDSLRLPSPPISIPLSEQETAAALHHTAAFALQTRKWKMGNSSNTSPVMLGILHVVQSSWVKVQLVVSLHVVMNLPFKSGEWKVSGFTYRQYHRLHLCPFSPSSSCVLLQVRLLYKMIKKEKLNQIKRFSVRRTPSMNPRINPSSYTSNRDSPAVSWLHVFTRRTKEKRRKVSVQHRYCR